MSSKKVETHMHEILSSQKKIGTKEKAQKMIETSKTSKQKSLESTSWWFQPI